ncbi:phospho-sugar mutase [Carnobacterium sp.]|uniref:phospho-sugar mutase n=1 Tax=Carnobacterium sp. TaxID=48221 RepID=UPI0028A60FD0|nr:phospho-sugar mutase [Carnobacterium sp.]
MRQEAYTYWKEKLINQPLVTEELNRLTEEEITHLFGNFLDFGTGGMRGTMGIGTNRLNVYTIKRVALGLGRYLIANHVNPNIVIAYDTRQQSLEFANETARVMATLGIETFIFKEATPTPELSFAVRELSATAGVVITASHNSAEYNGFKVYNQKGGQATPTLMNKVKKFVESVDDYLEYTLKDYDELKRNGKIRYLAKEIDALYLSSIQNVSFRKGILQGSNAPSILYSPLHGTGDKLVPTALQQAGIKRLQVLEKQQTRDGSFSTAPSPNPEQINAFSYLLEAAKQLKSDLLLATDPDADRLGVMCLHKGRYQLLSGNEVGILMLSYILDYRKEGGILKSADTVLSTIVSTSLVDKIAKKNEIKSIKLLTGFKYIGEYIATQHLTTNFLLGFEESCGYLICPFVQDKDSIQAAILVAEMTGYFKQFGKTLIDELEEIYHEYGYYQTALETIQLKEDSKKSDSLMEHFRHLPEKTLKELDVLWIEDFYTGKRHNCFIKKESERIQLPKENVLKFITIEGDWVCIRPSGTEAKLKIYYECRGHTKEESEKKIDHFKTWVKQIFDEQKSTKK